MCSQAWSSTDQYILLRLETSIYNFSAANIRYMSMDKLDKCQEDRFFAVLEMIVNEKGLGLAIDAAGF